MFHYRAGQFSEQRVYICERRNTAPKALKNKRSTPYPCLERHSAVDAFQRQGPGQEVPGGPIEADFGGTASFFQTAVGKTDIEFTFIRFALNVASGE